MSKFMKAAGLAVAMLVLPTVAQAQLQLGARLGYAVPGGSVDQGETLSGFVANAVPLELDVGYRWNNFSLALFYQYNFGSAGSDLKAIAAAVGGSGASAAGQEFGLSGTWNFAPKAGLQPWVGLRIGYEDIYIKFDSPVGSIKGTASGWAYGLQGGLDFALGPITLGPYVTWDTGKSTKLKTEGGGQTQTGDIPSANQTWHNWFAFGAKAGITF
jgi:hypothetical protein